jgi:hypothetical protein
MGLVPGLNKDIVLYIFAYLTLYSPIRNESTRLNATKYPEILKWVIDNG